MSLQTDFTRKSEEIAAKTAALSKLFEGVSDLQGTAATDRRDAIKTANAELAALNAETVELQDLLGIEKSTAAAVKNLERPNGRQTHPDNDPEPNGEAAVKSLGDLIREAGVGPKFRGEIGELSHAAIKTLSTTADMVGQTQRLSLVLDAQETRTTADMMLQGTTNAAALEYYEETTYTNAAAEVAEGGAKPEAALDFTLVTEAVRKIAVWLPVTDEMLADNEGFESYLRGRLGFMIKQREELQILVGNGTAPNISGILDRSGIQTQAKGADDAQDAIYKAITKVRNTAFAEPTGIVIHPNDWEPIRLDRTADGLYIFGSPQEAGTERLWGLPVRITSNVTEGTAIVGAFRPDAQLFRRGGVSIAVSDSHASYFISNLLAVRAEERIGLAIYRPASFCSVTGL